MKARSIVVSAVVAFTLLLGLWSPAGAFSSTDPLKEENTSMVIPFYDVGPNMISLLVVSDTSFQGFPATGANVDLSFFDQACNLKQDATVKLTTNDVEFVVLNSLSGIPTQGVIFKTDNPSSSLCTTCTGDFFIAYNILINLTDNTLTRLDSIPEDDMVEWLRYERFNTLAATFGDSGAIRTTLTFFNALGGGVDADGGSCAGGIPGTVPCILGAIATLREALIEVLGDTPSPGDWVVTGGSATTPVSAGSIHMLTFDDQENPVGSFIIQLRCFERGRLNTFAPSLMSIVGHLFAFSLDPSGVGGGGWSLFQETVVELGAVDAIVSGYAHHSN